MIVHGFISEGATQLCAGVPEPFWDYVLDPTVGESPQQRSRRLHEGKRFCDLCPAATPCLTYGLASGLDGLWGGQLISPHGVLVAIPPRTPRPRARPPQVKEREEQERRDHRQ